MQGRFCENFAPSPSECIQSNPNDNFPCEDNSICVGTDTNESVFQIIWRFLLDRPYFFAIAALLILAPALTVYLCVRRIGISRSAFFRILISLGREKFISIDISDISIEDEIGRGGYVHHSRISRDIVWYSDGADLASCIVVAGEGPR